MHKKLSFCCPNLFLSASKTCFVCVFYFFFISVHVKMPTSVDWPHTGGASSSRRLQGGSQLFGRRTLWRCFFSVKTTQSPPCIQDSEPQKLELTGPDGDRDRWRSLALSIINEWFRRAGQRPGQPVDGTQLFQALVEMDQASLASSLADDLLAW